MHLTLKIKLFDSFTLSSFHDKTQRSHIVETEPFHDTFGPKAQRKRPRLDVGTFEELSASSAAVEAAASAASSSAHPITLEAVEAKTHADYIEPIYSKGTSRRIYGELYKVIDSSDVILHVLDARDPLGTICTSVLEYMKKEKAHKQVVLVLNKCDLVPAWVTVRVFSLFLCLFFLFLSSFLPLSTRSCSPRPTNQVKDLSSLLKGGTVTFVEDQLLPPASLCASFRCMGESGVWRSESPGRVVRTDFLPVKSLSLFFGR
jgi:hypothetical protein